MADPTEVTVSVVIPAFQGAPWIHSALASVADQKINAGAIEVVIVDDGSTDDTWVAAEQGLIDFQLAGIVIRQPNRGVSSARNTGWNAARGRWIQFLDVDDELAKDKLATQLAVIEAADSRCAVVYSAWQRMVLDGTSWLPSGPVEDPLFDEPVQGIVEDMWFGYLGPCLIRREALESVDGLDETKSLGEDLDLMLRLAEAGWGFLRASASDPLFYYRQTSGSLWRRASSDVGALRAKNDTEVTAEAHLHRLLGNRLPARTRSALAERYMLTYQFARTRNSALSDDLLRQIAMLHLRRAPQNAPRSVRAFAPVVGLGTALRAYALVRTAVPSK
ncbi:glycosyltransferase family 2 protein [Rathayibacter sp. CAU 1779]